MLFLLKLHKTEATLLEKNNMLNKTQKDLDFIQSAHTASEEKCHTEMVSVSPRWKVSHQLKIVIVSPRLFLSH